MKAVQRCLLFVLIIGNTMPALAAIRPSTPVNPVESIYKNFPGLKGITLADYKEYSPREYEKASGKKLRFGEKIVYKVIKWNLKKTMRRAPTKTQKTLGWLSMGFGVLALCLIMIPSWIGWIGIFCAVGGLILGIKSLKGNSNAPGLIGLILSSAVLLITILAVISLATLKALD